MNKEKKEGRLIIDILWWIAKRLYFGDNITPEEKKEFYKIEERKQTLEEVQNEKG